MVLGAKILRQMAQSLGIEAAMVQPASADLRLGGEILELQMPFAPDVDKHTGVALSKRYPVVESRIAADLPDEWMEHLDLTKSWVYHLDPGDDFLFHPNKFYLLHTLEELAVPDHMVANVQLKSTPARHGLVMPYAALFDPGFRGTAVLEIVPLLWYLGTVGEPIVQVSFYGVIGGEEYRGRYQGQAGVTPPRPRVGDEAAVEMDEVVERIRSAVPIVAEGMTDEQIVEAIDGAMSFEDAVQMVIESATPR